MVTTDATISNWMHPTNPKYDVRYQRITVTTDGAGAADVRSGYLNGKLLKIAYDKGTVNAATTVTITTEVSATAPYNPVAEAVDSYDINTGSKVTYASDLAQEIAIAGYLRFVVVGGALSKTFYVLVYLTDNVTDIGSVSIGALGAGSNIIGKVGIDQTTNGTTNHVHTTLAYKGQDRTTTTGAAEELTIPAASTKVILSCGPNSQSYINLNADATTASPLYLEDPFGPLILDLGSVTKLSAYVVAGNIGAVFYG